MIMMATPEKPFRRAAKGSVMRKATYELYESEIAQLYKPQDEFSVHESDGIDVRTDLASIKAVVRTALHTCLASSNLEYTDNDDIFFGGFDSLRVLQMSKILSRVFRAKALRQPVCLPRFIYNNPTINQLSRAIQQRITGNDHNVIKASPTLMSREKKMSAMIHKYTKSLPAGPVTGIPPPSGKYTAILTGSTGSLGTYLLHYLLRSPLFERIYCFNCSADAESRQMKSLYDRGLHADDLAEKVDFLNTDLTQAQFGLSSSKYLELQENVNVFLHNAWPVNFNNSLESFGSTAIIGVRRCIDFALSARHRPHIMFASSIAIVGNWPVVRDDAPVPEIFEDDACIPLKQGYGESKHVASSILFRAARKSGLRATVLRLGQLGGSADGAGARNKTGKQSSTHFSHMPTENH
jgi:aryl carrier-like protein